MNPKPKPSRVAPHLPQAGAGNAKTTSKTKAPHKLDLYRLAVQQPWFQVNWLVNAYAAHYPGRWARTLREDFSGASALAIAWVAHDHDHSAIAIDNHGPTIRFAQKRASQLAKISVKPNVKQAATPNATQPPLDTQRLAFHHRDVMDPQNATLPQADLLIAFNFSINIHHDFQSLVAYFKNARASLSEHGLFVMDCYGGPGAWRVSTQHRRIRPPRSENIPAFDYYWQQQDVDPLTGLVRCAIDFKTKAQGRINNAFVYHWRLWSPPEILEALTQAGYGRAQVWCTPPEMATETDAAKSHTSPEGEMLEPVERIGPREDFLAYITAEK